MQDIFAKWRLTAILSLLLREKNVEQLILDLEEQDIIDPSSQFPHVQVQSPSFLSSPSSYSFSSRSIPKKLSMNSELKTLLSSRNSNAMVENLFGE
jgi:hypothetical protein